jgi:biopolymer transport protein ExbB
MEHIKKYLYAAVLYTAVLFPVPSVIGAQVNDQGGNDKTIESTIVEEMPEVVIQERKTMWGLVKSGGLMMVPLALMALYGFYCGGVQMYVILFSNNDQKDQELLSRLNPHEVSYEDDMPKILQEEILKRDRAAFPKMAEAALKAIYGGKTAVEEALMEEGALQLSRLKRGIKPLQGVVTVAPLMGLLGTVYGMIASFQSMGTAGDDKVKFLSEGIYEALVTTAAGLTIAIPFLFLYLWLSRKTDEIGENLNRQARSFLGTLFPEIRGGVAQGSGGQQPVGTLDLEQNTT